MREGRKAHGADELGIKATPFDPRETVASDVLKQFTLPTVLGHEVQVRSRLVHVKQFNDVRVWRTQLHQGDLAMYQCRLLPTKKTTFLSLISATVKEKAEEVKRGGGFGLALWS